MKKLTCLSPGHFAYGDEEIALPRKGEALLRVARVGICGTDLHAFEGTQPYFTYPRILGHELACEVVEVNDIAGFGAGDRVTVLPYFSCGQCHACKQGKTNCCVSLKVCGVHVDGGMREYFTVPGSTLVHGRDIESESLAVVEPLAIGAHAVRRGGVGPQDDVLVVGAGPIGLATMLFAEKAGANLMMLDVNEWRLKFCEKLPGRRTVINAQTSDVLASLRELTSGRMPSVVFDATGNIGAINQAFSYMSHGGKYVLVGLQKENISFSHPEFHKREGTVMSSRNATREDFEFVIETILSGKLDPAALVTDRLGFAKVGEEFGRLLRPESKVIKAIVEF